MSYAALASLAQTLDNFLLDHDQQQFIDVVHHLQPIKSLVISLLTFLDNHFPAGEAGNLEARIRIAANQAEDIIDHHISDILILSPDLVPNRNRRLCQVLTKSLKKFESILNQFNQIIIEDPNISAGSFPPRPAPTSTVVVGLDRELTEIKDRLCGEPSNKLQIIPIVGMGGIGKTTLARCAHDDPLTLHHFDVRVWVTVSQENSTHGILSAIFDSIDATQKKWYLGVDIDEMASAEILARRVYQYLKGRRYVIVMDDIWSTNVWDELRRVFPDDFNGSRVVITTRLLEVASYVVDSSNRPYEMHLMDVDRSWRLLKEKVFGERRNCTCELEHIGRLVAENCRGLPLAIVVIAGVLSKADRTQESWANIARNVKTVVNNNAGDERFSKILSLSYAYLPHYLRPCFLYLGCFPEDHEINVSKLVKLWAAEGFVRPNGSGDLEEAAEECLEDLVKRSLVLVSKKKYNSRIKCVKIHDLLRDLCISKAYDERFLRVINEVSSQAIIGWSSRRISNLVNILGGFRKTNGQSSRRLSIWVNILGGFRNTNGSPVRTILLFKHAAVDSWRSFRLLRVVDALNILMRSYPDQICELIHLRYLGLSFEPDHRKKMKSKVPESLLKLKNLETLILRVSSITGLTGTLYLPFRIWRMPQLRHLILLNGFLPDPSLGVTKVVLENLRTLSRVQCFTCSENMLQVMPNLKKLRIHYNSSDIYETGWSKYSLNNLGHFHKLEKLHIDGAGPWNFKVNENHLSRNLVAFPLTLKKLTLIGCGVPWEDMTIVGSLPDLEVLKLKRHACHGFEWETSEGEFIRLKVLSIDTTDLEEWVAESGSFPRLERLALYGCDKLGEIPSGIGEIATLELIEVDGNNLAVVKSAKSIEDEQLSFGNEIRITNTGDRYVPSSRSIDVGR